MIEIVSISHDEEGIFLKRVNRFVGLVKLQNEMVEVHVHDTGRLSELLYPGNRVLIRRAKNPSRKTKWDILASFFDGEWILTNSSYHSRIFEETLKKVEEFSGFRFRVKREIVYNHSRLDFLLESGKRRILVEVKGCTLRKGKVALFPDAPTQRGKKHIEELIRAKKEGYGAWIAFVVMHSKAECFMPNREQDPAFTEVFREAISKGVEVLPLKYYYDGMNVYFTERIPLCNF